LLLLLLSRIPPQEHDLFDYCLQAAINGKALTLSVRLLASRSPSEHLSIAQTFIRARNEYAAGNVVEFLVQRYRIDAELLIAGAIEADSHILLRRLVAISSRPSRCTSTSTSSTPTTSMARATGTVRDSRPSISSSSTSISASSTNSTSMARATGTVRDSRPSISSSSTSISASSTNSTSMARATGTVRDSRPSISSTTATNSTTPTTATKYGKHNMSVYAAVTAILNLGDLTDEPDLKLNRHLRAHNPPISSQGILLAARLGRSNMIPILLSRPHDSRVCIDRHIVAGNSLHCLITLCAYRLF
jgi:hypothetical protein